MSKRIKTLITNELQKKLAGTDSLVVIDYTGIDATTTNGIRVALRAKKVKLTVVRNAMAAKALTNLGMGDVAGLLKGTNAVVYGGESVVDIVKELVDQAKKIEKLKIKGSFVDGKLLDSKTTEALAKLPSKKELQSIIVGQILGPGRSIAGQLKGPGGKLASQVNAVIEKAEKGSAAEPAPAPAAA